MTLTIILSTIIFLMAPAEALAWGAGVHLQIGSHILANLETLSPLLQNLLGAWPHDFLYGCISADITLGKKYTHYLKHCHSWRMGKKILEAAQSDPEKACAYGYLSHLAADTVAHSYFVPFKMVRTFKTALLKHTYWELRLENEVAPEIWALARTIAGKDFSYNDAMMRKVLSDTIFSFNTNKRIFNSIMLLSRLQQWQKVLRSLSDASKWTIEEEDREDYLSLAREASGSVLGAMEKSPFWQADPTGEQALEAAGMIRKNLHHLWLEGKLSESGNEEFLAGLKPRLREGITAPERVLELLSMT